MLPRFRIPPRFPKEVSSRFEAETFETHRVSNETFPRAPPTVGQVEEEGSKREKGGGFVFLRSADLFPRFRISPRFPEEVSSRFERRRLKLTVFRTKRLVRWKKKVQERILQRKRVTWDPVDDEQRARLRETRAISRDYSSTLSDPCRTLCLGLGQSEEKKRAERNQGFTNSVALNGQFLTVRPG